MTEPKHIRVVDGIPCITLTEHEHIVNELSQRLHEVSLSWQVGQARETKLRDALTKIATNTIHWYASIQDAKAALAMPVDDSALKEALKVEYRRGYDDGFLVGAEKGRNFSEEIKQAKREVLLEAANIVSQAVGQPGNDWGEGYTAATKDASRGLRRMAEELK
jgi:hypothetical protein